MPGQISDGRVEVLEQGRFHFEIAGTGCAPEIDKCELPTYVGPPETGWGGGVVNFLCRAQPRLSAASTLLRLDRVCVRSNLCRSHLRHTLALIDRICAKRRKRGFTHQGNP